MIRALIFDIGNVLLRFDFSLAMKRLVTTHDGVSDAMAAALEPIKAAYENGDFDRAEFHRRAVAALSFAGSERQFTSAWEEIFTENKPVTALVEKLHATYPLYLLSNTSDLHLDHVVRTYPVFRFFKDGVYSFHAKCSKPGRQIFEIAIRQFGVSPAETIYLDDLAPNVETALQLGLRAIRYDPDQHETALAALEREGVRVD